MENERSYPTFDNIDLGNTGIKMVTTQPTFIIPDTWIPRQYKMILIFFNWRSILEEYSTWILPQNIIASIYLHPAKEFGNILYSKAFSAPHCHESYEQFLRIRILGMINRPRKTCWDQHRNIRHDLLVSVRIVSIEIGIYGWIKWFIPLMLTFCAGRKPPGV